MIGELSFSHFLIPARIFTCAINVTSACNHSCKYCSVNLTDGFMEPSIEVIEQFITECFKRGVRIVSLTGGEPFLRRDICKIISFIKNQGMKVEVSSDSISNIDSSYLNGVDYVQLSLDGPQDIHDRLRYHGSFDNLMKSIEILKTREIDFWTLTVLTKENYDCIDFILDSAKKNGFLAYFQPIDSTYFTKNQKFDELRTNSYEINKTMSQLIKKKKEGMPVGNSFGCLEYYLNDDSCYDCFAGNRYVYMHFDSKIYPCWNCSEIYKVAGFLNLKEFKNHYNKANCKTCKNVFCIELNLLFNLKYQSRRIKREFLHS